MQIPFKNILVCFLAVFTVHSVNAQGSIHQMMRMRDRAFSVSATVLDSLSGEPLSFASVYLTPESDTLITHFTLADQKGKAILDQVTRGNYTLNVEMMGYRPFRKNYYFSGRTILGKILLQEDARVLDAAKVSAAVRPMEVRQDTVIYHAAAFSIAENDVLRDLLKKMPGIEVDEDGSVKVQGEAVSQITVNGRTFFMGDKRAALDNLPAKAVDKIQVTDKEADIEKITGIRSRGASRSKKMDVALKQEYSNGVFGNLQAHGGASVPDRDQDEMVAVLPFLWNTSGMLSAFGEKDQLTLIARGQNVNPGNQIQFRTPSGITTGGQAGANLSTDRIKSLETGVSVSYNGSSHQDASRVYSEDYPISEGPVTTGRSSHSLNDNHQITASMDLKGKRIKGVLFSFTPTLSFADRSTSNTSASESRLNGQLSNQSNSENSSRLRSISSRGELVLITNRFRKKGRSLSLEGSYSTGGEQGNSRDYSLSRFAASNRQDLKDLHYDQSGNSGSGSLNLSFVEPLSEKWLLQTGVSGLIQFSGRDKSAFNADGSENAYYSTVSRSKTLNGRGYSLIQYKDETITLQTGVSLSVDNLYTFSRALGRESEVGKGEWLRNWSPVFTLNTPWFLLDYHGRSSHPRPGQMLSLLDITDPLRISTGNMFLRPAFYHDIRLTKGPGNRKGPSAKKPYSFNGYISASIQQNPVVSAVWYDADRVRYTIPVNSRKPGISLMVTESGYVGLGPSQKWRLMFDCVVQFTRNVNYQPVGVLSPMDTRSFDYSAFMAEFWGDKNGNRFYDGTSGFRESRTRQLTYRPHVDLTYHSPDHLSLTWGNSLSGSHAWYSVDQSANNNTYIYASSLEVTYTTPHRFILITRYSLNRYFGFSDSFSNLTNNLNFSLMKDFKAFTVTLQARDVLNAGLSIHHSVNATGFSDSYQLSMGRHFLVGAAWRFGRMGSRQLRNANRSSDQMMNSF